MDYKAVIEEQIRELQKVQAETHYGDVDSKISLARAIAALSTDANNLYVKEG